VEAQSFTRDARAAISESELEELKTFLASYPESGAVIPGTGGVRKLRWAASGRGTRGGARVIYYYHNLEMPLFLIAFFAKNVKADLSAAEKRATKQLAEALLKEFRPRK
jgi:hypothetical protein